MTTDPQHLTRPPLPPQTWPENRYATAEEWLEWLDSMTPEARRWAVADVLHAAHRGGMCRQLGHDDYPRERYNLVATQLRLAEQVTRLRHAWHSARRRARAATQLAEGETVIEYAIRWADAWPGMPDLSPARDDLAAVRSGLESSAYDGSIVTSRVTRSPWVELEEESAS